MDFGKLKKSILSLALLYLFSPHFVLAEASLGLSATKNNFSVGDIIPVSIYVSANESINAFDGKISFSKDVLEIQSISKSGSIVNFWVSDPSFSNTSGTIQFEGVVLNPGFTGSNGKILTLNIKAKQVGNGSLSFLSGSVLANDGQGKDVLSNTIPLNISISDKVKNEIKSTTSEATKNTIVITSPTHPDQTKWYNRSKAIISWVLPENALSVRATIDRNSNTIPDTDIGLVSSKQYENLSDGILYAHVRVKTKDGFSDTSHFKIQIDTSSPRSFDITFPHGIETDNPSPVILFNTSDSLSGIDFYRVKIGGDYVKIDPKIIDSNPYTPPNQTPGHKQIIVEAYDKAGNITKSSANLEILSIDPPKITSYSDFLIEGDIFKVRGETYPDSRVDIFVKNYDGKVFAEFTKSNTLGDFALVLSKQLSPDVYTLTAIVTDNRGAQSIESKAVTFKVEPKPFAKIGKMIISYGFIIMLVISFLLIIPFMVWFAWHKFIVFKRKIRKEVNEADKVLHRAFKILRTDLEDQMNNLLKVKKQRDLTKEETKILNTFKKNFKEAEDVLTKEIEDIEDSIDH